MAWTHRRILYRAGQNRFILHYSGQADVSDLDDYVLFDISADAPGFTKTQVMQLQGQAGGLYAVLEWDATTDAFICAFPDGPLVKYPPPFDREDLVAGDMIIDPIPTGTTGDILLTTFGGAVGGGVNIDAIIVTL